MQPGFSTSSIRSLVRACLAPSTSSSKSPPGSAIITSDGMGVATPTDCRAQLSRFPHVPTRIEVLAAEVGDAPAKPVVSEMAIPISSLEPGLRLAAPVVSTTDTVLVNSGEVVSTELAGRLRALAAAGVVASESVTVITAHY